MAHADALFNPTGDMNDEGSMIAAAFHCIDAFTVRFNARDLGGMDACLHFPHIVLSGEQLVIWDKPGNLPETFFEHLHRDTGWVESRYLDKRAVLVSPCKVHVVVNYTRNRADGSVVSKHANLWVVTFDHGRWGIKHRSY